MRQRTEAELAHSTMDVGKAGKQAQGARAPGRRVTREQLAQLLAALPG